MGAARIIKGRPFGFGLKRVRVLTFFLLASDPSVAVQTHSGGPHIGFKCVGFDFDW